ncbi:hypothetical protein QEG98_24440 [Myxococcus sp. MxC21-1]|uniref:hypothetical protein n=1 Tax=Myxococcus sp. MxC21-1 TaxID=3041439 RepID=UPI0029318599|nr:hypothetical protein [Myxococcus sp. MxC21-1]WNZ59231.1 hypothetical protein QEG98_24440 [Myxococcus sp. MxC21-1]
MLALSDATQGGSGGRSGSAVDAGSAVRRGSAFLRETGQGLPGSGRGCCRGEVLEPGGLEQEAARRSA